MLLVRDVFQAKYGKGTELVIYSKKVIERGGNKSTHEYYRMPAVRSSP